MKKLRTYMLLCCTLCSLTVFSANRNIDSLLAVIDTATGSNKADACLLACDYYYRNNNDEALRFARTALEISDKIKYREGKKRAWYELGVAYDHRGVFDTALVYLNQAMEYGMQDKDSLFIAQVHINKGNIFYYQGNYDSTLFCYIEASRLFEVLGNRRGEANSYLGQGNVFYQQGMYDKAVKYFKDALKIYHELKDEVLISYALNNIGTAYYVQGDLQTATEYFIKSIEIKRKLRDQFGEAYTLNNLGDIYFEQSLYSLALDYYKKSLKIREELGETQGIISTRAKIANTLLFENKYAESEAYIKETMIMAKEAGTLLYLKDLHETLVNIYANTGDFRKALEFQEILNHLKDSLLGLEKNEYMAEIAAGYENERNEKELALLKKTQEINGLEMEKREQEELKQYIILGSFILGIIIISVFSVLLIRRYRERKKTNLLLEKQNLEITIQKNRIQKQRDEIKKQRDDIEIQRDLATRQRDQIERQKQEITDSINYAERIQIAMLPPVEAIGTLPGDCFVLLLPRDIVSGDFYWIMERQNIRYIAVADCTGHGVPGAFMSMLGISFLNEIISSSEYLNPAQILELLREKIQETFRNSGRDDKSATVLDGMDIALCAINTEKKRLDFAGANLSLYQLSGEKITEHPGEKIQVSAASNNNRMFILKTINYLMNDCFYLMSDGFADQFGGNDGKKFKHSGVLALFESFNSMNMAGQREKLEDAHRIWKGQYEQVDDILILGFKT